MFCCHNFCPRANASNPILKWPGPPFYTRVCVCVRACFSKVQLMSVHNEAKSLHCRTHIVAVCLLFGVFFYSFFYLFLSSQVVCLFISLFCSVCLPTRRMHNVPFYVAHNCFAYTSIYARKWLSSTHLSMNAHTRPLPHLHTHTLAHTDSCLLYCVFN